MSKILQRKQILSLTDEGYSPAEIAILLGGLSELDVSAVIKRFGHLSRKTSDAEPKVSQKEVSSAVFGLKSKGYTIEEIALDLDYSVKFVESVIDHDRQKIKNRKEWVSMLEQYRNGSTLQEIGIQFNLTRERVRQLIKAQLSIEHGYGPSERKFHTDEIIEEFKHIVKSSSTERTEDETLRKINDAREKGVQPQYFESVHSYNKAVGTVTENLKKFAPEVYQILKANQRIRDQRWHKYYSECRMCHTTNHKYKGRGYCSDCYTKSPEWKESQERYRLNNLEKFKEKNKQYQLEYSQRPEVKARIEAYTDEKHFGGNRKFALERDDYRCVKCGKDMSEKDKLGKSKVRVWHLNGKKDDNRLDNLGTYCLSCYTKYIRITPLSR